MVAHTIEISDLTALDALEVRGSLTRPIRGEIILRLPALGAQESRDWQTANPQCLRVWLRDEGGARS